MLNRQEGQNLLSVLDGVPWLMAIVLYGSGLRLMECLRLRVKDIDFTRHEVLVRQGKGNKDRVTMLSTAVAPKLQAHLEGVRELYDADLAAGLGRVSLPHALARKYPSANREFGWQWIFPASRICTDPRFGPPQRYHLHESVPQRDSRGGAQSSYFQAGVSAHPSALLRDHLIESGYDIRTAQEVLGYKDVATTMIYYYARAEPRRRGVQSLANGLAGGQVLARADEPHSKVDTTSTDASQAVDVQRKWRKQGE